MDCEQSRGCASSSCWPIRGITPRTCGPRLGAVLGHDIARGRGLVLGRADWSCPAVLKDQQSSPFGDSGAASSVAASPIFAKIVPLWTIRLTANSNYCRRNSTRSNNKDLYLIANETAGRDVLHLETCPRPALVTCMTSC